VLAIILAACGGSTVSIRKSDRAMPSQTDLYFPVTDARYEAAFIPSLWGHPAGAGASPADGKFLNEHIAGFLDGKIMKN
jgi:homoserine O-acetyltransferase/O-succinyltransferase